MFALYDVPVNKNNGLSGRYFEMKHVKRNLLLFTAAVVLSMAPAATAMAAEYQTPADTAAEVTGRSVEDVARELSLIHI